MRKISIFHDKENNIDWECYIELIEGNEYIIELYCPNRQYIFFHMHSECFPTVELISIAFVKYMDSISNAMMTCQFNNLDGN